MIDTPRLRLRRPTPADAPFILRLVNEPGWLQHIGDRHIHDLAAAEAYLLKGPMESHARWGFGMDAVERKDTGEAIGLCGLIQRDYLDAPDLGYALLAAHHGLGFASEAATGVRDHARAVLGLSRLHAITSQDNHASMRVLQKLGFMPQGEISAPGYDTPSRLFLLAG